MQGRFGLRDALKCTLVGKTADLKAAVQLRSLLLIVRSRLTAATAGHECEHNACRAESLVMPMTELLCYKGILYAC